MHRERARSRLRHADNLIKRILSSHARIPIKWRLTLWSSFLLFFLFAAYNGIQSVVVERWTVSREQKDMERELQEISNVLLAKEYDIAGRDYAAARSDLQRMNRHRQLIRLLDRDGNPVVVASQDMPEDWKEDQVLIRSSPLTIYRFDGYVEIVRSMEHYDRMFAVFFRVMLICSAGAALISAAGGWLLAGQMLKSLQTVNETMRRVKKNGVRERVILDGAQDEIYLLKKMFNEMMDQLERSARQQRQFVEDASHELRTPIAILEGHLGMLRRWGKRDAEVLDESLRISLEELARLKGLVQEMLSLTHAEQPIGDEPRACIGPKRVLQRAVHNLRMVHPSFRFELDIEELAGHGVAIAASRLEQVVLIVLDNAVKYSGDSRIIRIKAGLDGRFAVLKIVDFGIGIAEQDLERSWDRFYRAERSRGGKIGGYGLGLSIAKRLVEHAGGRIELTSRQGHGTTATIHFPLLGKLPAQKSGAPAYGPAAEGEDHE
ncbi:sensor histidine kinase [Paenibacillaceae bacterium WGS1546]|uniref:sensor histidine kinase n=1 Tax=Cohnella sp. WGS1546 TaxID=3366810 RepID=UPI00372D435C